MNSTMKAGRKKIIFIIPPYFNIEEYVSKSHISQKPVFTIPYGILSLAAYVKAFANWDIEVEIIDLNLEAARLLNTSGDIGRAMRMIIKERTLRFNPDIVGISALFNTCFHHLEFISDEVKHSISDVLLIIGGGLATNLPSEILSNFKLIDACCYGEGEVPLCELLNAANAFEYLNSSPSWITQQSLQSLRRSEHLLVQDLDVIPSFDYDLINLDNYQGRSPGKGVSLSTSREITLHTSRGCPFNCIFCANASVHGKKVRYMSVEKVMAEIQRMIRHYHLKTLLIEDDHFLGNKSRAKEILRRISKLNLKVDFPNGMAVYAIDHEIGRLLKNAGVKMITLAVESGSDYVLNKIIQKPHRVDMIQPAVEILKKNGISVDAFIIVGLPGELETHREETMKMVMNVGFDWVKFSLAVPVVGSRLYDICKKNGYLVSNDYSRHVITKANIKTPDIDPDYIQDKVYLMNLEANFIQNHNLKTGNFQRASVYFKNIVEKYPGHAFAHLFLSKSYAGLRMAKELVDHHHHAFQQIIKTDAAWNRYANHFSLTADCK